MQEETNKPAAGRPTTYTKVLGIEICEKIADNPIDIRIIFKNNRKFPSVSTFYNWLADNPELEELYTRAKERQAMALFFQMLKIADDNSRDLIETTKGPVINNAAVNRAKLQVSTRNMMISRLAPKVYGDKITIVTNDHLQKTDYIDESKLSASTLRELAAFTCEKGTAATGQE